MARRKKVIDPGPRLKQQFILPILPPSMNELIKLLGKRSENRKYTAYNESKQNWHGDINAIVKSDEWVPYQVPVWVHLDFYINKKMDFGNVDTCQKFIIDGLVASGLFYSDSQQWCHPVTTSYYPPKKDVAVIVTVYNYPMYHKISAENPELIAAELVKLFDPQMLREIYSFMGNALHTTDQPQLALK